MNKRKWNLDIIRITACVMVVALHVTVYGNELRAPQSMDWIIRNFIGAFLRCAVPFFFMISGILFMEREIPLKKLFGKYIARLFFTWLIWSVFYAMIDFVAQWKKGTASWQYLFSRIAEGHYHMWFLPAMIGVYVFFPLIKLICVQLSFEQSVYFLIIVLATVVLQKTLEPFAVAEGLNAFIWNQMDFPVFTVGTVYFMLGYLLHRYRERIPDSWCLICYVVSIVGIIVVNMLISFREEETLEVVYGYLNLGVFLSSCSLFTYIIKKTENWIPDRKYQPLIKEISQCTLGIYMIHPLFIEQVYRRVGLYQEQFPTVLAVVLFTGCTFCISGFCVFVFQRLARSVRRFLGSGG